MNDGSNLASTVCVSGARGLIETFVPAASFVDGAAELELGRKSGVVVVDESPPQPAETMTGMNNATKSCAALVAVEFEVVAEV